MKPSQDIDMSAIQAELDALPSTGKGTARDFTPEMDAALLYARERGTPWSNVVSWWKQKYGWGCQSTLQRRWNEIKEG